MKQIVKLNWKIADLIREKQSFANWYWNVFKLAPSPKDLKDIKKRERELAQMKQAVLDAEVISLALRQWVKPSRYKRPQLS
jgi:hypothetical protein